MQQREAKSKCKDKYKNNLDVLVPLPVTKGQQAMALAMMYPENGGPGGRGKKDPARLTQYLSGRRLQSSHWGAFCGHLPTPNAHAPGPPKECDKGSM